MLRGGRGRRHGGGGRAAAGERGIWAHCRHGRWPAGHDAGVQGSCLARSLPELARQPRSRVSGSGNAPAHCSGAGRAASTQQSSGGVLLLPAAQRLPPCALPSYLLPRHVATSVLPPNSIPAPLHSVAYYTRLQQQTSGQYNEQRMLQRSRRRRRHEPDPPPHGSSARRPAGLCPQASVPLPFTAATAP